MINSSSTEWGNYRRKVKKNYTDFKADVGGFWGFIAKFFMNIQFAYSGANAPKIGRMNFYFMLFIFYCFFAEF